MEIGYIKKREITEEMKESYLDYAMSVIISRALPDVRDGLKPVHRRILYSMHEMGLTHTAKYRKSAAVTGFCMGAFHPHGDTPIYEALVRMAQNFSLRYPLVDGQGNFGCFTKDIKVRLTDGRGLTFGELIKEAKKGKRNWTFSFNPEIQKIEIAEIENPRLTRRKEKIMEITLDNGKNIKCTLDHLFMLRNGSYKKAKDLKAGNSLMPLYTEIYQGEDTNLRGYEIMCQPLENTWDFVHHLADKWNLRNGIYEKSKGKIRHHLDFNKLNNNPDNVLRIQWGDHWKFHKEIASERHKNDQEYVKKIAEGRRKFWAKKENKKLYSQLRAEKNRVMWRNPKYREMWIEARKKMWEDPKYKEFMRKASSKNLKNLWKRKDFQELMSKIKSQELKRRWQNESYRNIMAEWMRKLSLKIWLNPQHREYISKLMKEKSNDPNWRKRQSKIAKALWRDPEYRAKYSPDHFSKMAKKLWGDPQFRELHREKAIKQWQNPEFKEKIIKAVRIRNKQRMKENPEFMKGLTERAKISLHKNWQDPFYKERVIKSKILGFVYSLLGKYKKITPRIYEQERTNNGVPRLKNALDYFDSLSEIINKAQKYNHQIVATRVLQKRKDVYDLTIEPYHNFCLDAGVFVHNSIDADPPASQRYTESRLSKMAEEMLFDIDKETVDWIDNYDTTRKEPTVLPAKLPQLLLNGSMGIAVGMATNIPPHHLGELVEGIIFLIDHPKAATEELCQFIKGPDFPTGGFIYDRPGIIQAYSTGRGPIVSRAKTEIVEKKAGQFQVLITEMTYGVNKAALIEKIADLVKEKKIEGIKDIRDESDKEGVRVVIDLKSDAYPQKILHRLFKLTDLQKTFHLNMLALVDGLQPQVLSLKAVLEHYIKHRQKVVFRRAQFELKQAKERAHILEGLSKALDQIDAVIQTIKKSLTREQAHQNLIKKFKLTSQQATAILEMKLQTLAGLEQKKIKDELKEKRKLIEELEKLLKSPKKILEKIKNELQEIKEKYQDNRRTKVYASPVGQFKEEEMVPEEECIIILTQGGYVKRVSPRGYRTQKRGGRGILGITPREEDVVGHFFSASSHDNILFFTGQGRVFQTKAYEIPEASRTARGQAIVNILQMGPEEKVTAIVPLRSKGSEAKFLLMTTKNGINKKTAVEEFVHVRRSGLVAIKLDQPCTKAERLVQGKGDELKWARPSSGQDEIILVTTKGQSIRFKEKDVRPMGRPAAGVRGIKLRKGDEVVGMDVINSKFEIRNSKLLVVTENGFGKKTDLRYYKLQKRGGSGIKTAKITSKTGNIVASQILGPGQEDLIAISQKGQVIRTKLKDISTLGRATQGVRIMRLDKGDKVASVTCI